MTACQNTTILVTDNDICRHDHLEKMIQNSNLPALHLSIQSVKNSKSPQKIQIFQHQNSTARSQKTEITSIQNQQNLASPSKIQDIGLIIAHIGDPEGYKYFFKHFCVPEVEKLQAQNITCNLQIIPAFHGAEPNNHETKDSQGVLVCNSLGKTTFMEHKPMLQYAALPPAAKSIILPSTCLFGGAGVHRTIENCKYPKGTEHLVVANTEAEYHLFSPEWERKCVSLFANHGASGDYLSQISSMLGYPCAIFHSNTRSWECFTFKYPENTQSLQRSRVPEFQSKSTALPKSVRQQTIPVTLENIEALLRHQSITGNNKQLEQTISHIARLGCSQMVNNVSEHLFTPLHNILRTQNRPKTSTLKHLLKLGANTASIDLYHKSPLTLACKDKPPEVIKTLLAYTTDINAHDTRHLPLHEACEFKQKEIAIILLQHGANPNAQDANGMSAIHLACKKGNAEIAELLLQHKADVNARNETGRTPLHIACKNGNTEIAELLLQHKADVNARNETGRTPLHIACKNRNTEITELLLQHKADVRSQTKSGNSPLHLACKKGRLYTVECLLKHGANINLQTKSGHTPLHLACKKGHTHIIHPLIQHGAKINTCDIDGETPLHATCGRASVTSTKLLLENGALINALNQDGETPILAACKAKSKEIIETLVMHGAGIGPACKEWGLPLSITHKKSPKQLAAILLEAQSKALAARTQDQVQHKSSHNKERAHSAQASDNKEQTPTLEIQRTPSTAQPIILPTTHSSPDLHQAVNASAKSPDSPKIQDITLSGLGDINDPNPHIASESPQGIRTRYTKKTRCKSAKNTQGTHKTSPKNIDKVGKLEYNHLSK